MGVCVCGWGGCNDRRGEVWCASQEHDTKPSVSGRVGVGLSNRCNRELIQQKKSGEAPGAVGPGPC